MRSSRSEPDPLDPGPRGFAHRGLHGPGVPENSLAAFEAAIDTKAGIECDVRLSGDGAVVVFHDCDLSRLCGVALNVESSPAPALREQRLLETGQSIPLLRQLLSLPNGRAPLLLEVKTRDGNAARLCGALVKEMTGYAGPVGVMSFDPKVGGWLRWNAPHIRRGLVIGEDTGLFRRWFAMFIAAPQFLAIDHRLLSRPWVARMRRREPIYSWTIRTAEARAQASVQADALIWEADGRPGN